MVMWVVMRVIFRVGCSTTPKNASTKLTKLWGLIFSRVLRKIIEVTQRVTYCPAGHLLMRGRAAGRRIGIRRRVWHAPAWVSLWVRCDVGWGYVVRHRGRKLVIRVHLVGNRGGKFFWAWGQPSRFWLVFILIGTRLNTRKKNPLIFCFQNGRSFNTVFLPLHF